jgi:hypothetical protein
MKKKILVLVLAVSIGSGLFAQKYQPFDMLIGFNAGLGISPNFFGLIDWASSNSNNPGSNSNIPKGNYALIFDVGLSYDFYLFNWLSFNSGLFLHPDIYLILDQDLSTAKSFSEVMSTPLCLTIPLMAHVNVPMLDWLYAGIGLSFNFPLLGMLDSLVKEKTDQAIDTKGSFFVGLPIDIGIDFVKPDGGGGRFFIRITPEFHEKGTAVPIGFIWQINNWRIFSRQE